MKNIRKKIRYFDYTATTPISEEVMLLMNMIDQKHFMQPANDKTVRALEKQSKEVILEELKLDKEEYEVIYTSGGTEANNLAILGYSLNFETTKRYLTTKYEHSSVYDTFEHLKTNGNQIGYLTLGIDGSFDENELEQLLLKNPVMVCVMAVNNETGTVNQYSEIFRIVKQYNSNIVTMCDMVAAVGKIKLNFENIDMFVMSAHKIKGPKGVGVLVKRKRIPIKPLLYGGIKQGGYRAGTQSLAAQVGMAQAIKMAIGDLKDTQHVLDQKKKLFLSLLPPDIIINSGENCVGTVSISLPTRSNSNAVVNLLQREGFYLSSKSSCTSESSEPSRVLLAYKIDVEAVQRSLRVSFSVDTKDDDIELLVEIFKEIKGKM